MIQENEIGRHFNAIPVLAYWDIYKNYYSNKQEEKGAVITAWDINEPVMPVSLMIIQSPEGDKQIPQAPGTGQEITFNDLHTTILNFEFEAKDQNYEDFDINTVYLVKPTGERLVRAVKIYPNWKRTYNRVEMRPDPVAPGQPSVLGLTIEGYTVIPDITGDVEPRIKMFDLENIDEARVRILEKIRDSDPIIIDETWPEPYNLPLKKQENPFGESIYNKETKQEGLALKTYQSDLFNNYLNSEWIDGQNGINEISKVKVEDGAITIDAINLASKVYNMLNRVAVSGGTHYDWIEVTWDVEPPRQSDEPVYEGGLIKEIVFQEVISNSEAESGEVNQPLGTLGGRGVMGNKHKGGRMVIKTSEICWVLGIFSITPYVDYSQGNVWHSNLKTMNDFHNPGLDEIGFQDLITDQMAWWDTRITTQGTVEEPEYKSAGKQPAWINYMTSVNEIHGNFAEENEQQFMVLDRRYEPGRNSTGGMEIKDLTTYIDPSKFNYIFAETRRDAQNFWVNIGISITARQKMSAKLMPNL